MYRCLGPLRSFIPEPDVLNDFFTADDLPAVFDNVYVLDYQISDFAGNTVYEYWLAIDGEISIGLPGFDGAKLVFGSGDIEGYTFLNAALTVGDNGALVLNNVRMALRFDDDILKPATFDGTTPKQEHVEIQVEGTIRITKDFDIQVEGFDSFDLTPAMLGDSGIIISAEDVQLDLSRSSSLPAVKDAGYGDSFMGIALGNARVRLPEEISSLLPDDIVLENAVIGSGGVSAEKLVLDYSENDDDLPICEFFNMDFALKSITLEIKQNALKEFAINGKLTIPFFDEPVGVEIGIDLNGGFHVQLTSDDDTSLKELTLSDVLKLELDSLAFNLDGNDFKVLLSGALTPQFGNLDWPTFEIKELSIDSDGNVQIAGGWLDLPKQYALDFHGFQMELTKLGFGKTDNGRNWFGLSGGIKLVEGITAGASVEGLRVTWGNGETAVTFEGLGVEFEVEDVIQFKGEVSYREVEILDDEGNPKKDENENFLFDYRFDGDIKLNLLAVDLEIDASLVFGTRDRDDGDGQYNYFAIYIGVELPAGIPLGNTGIAIYGMAGLFALQMEPNKTSAEPWYGMAPGEGWYKKPDIGVTDLGKWEGCEGSLGLGAGVTIGTMSDNGFIFSGKLVLVIIFPGPIIMFEGKANLLTERSKLSDEAIFRALCVLDCREGTLVFGLDANYQYGKDAELIDIGGSTEAFFDFNDISKWHLYMGQKEPRERRLHADIISIFEADSYFMIDCNGLAMGSSIGYDVGWEFGPLKLALEAWIEGNAGVSFKPAYLYGDLNLHGKAEISIYGFGLGMSMDAVFEAMVFDPFHVLAGFALNINLPWPLPDFGVDFELEWPSDGNIIGKPPLPLPLQEVAIQHEKVSTTWPLPRKKLLLPNYDDGTGFWNESKNGKGKVVPSTDIANDTDNDETAVVIPVIPLDCRPQITFGRSVHSTGIGMAYVLNPGREQIGDPEKGECIVKVKYSLIEISLQKQNSDEEWMIVAQAPGTETDGIKELFGAWAPISDNDEESSKKNVKLQVWSKNPFGYVGHGGRSWIDWFTDKFPGYPCPGRPKDRGWLCCYFGRLVGERLEPGAKFTCVSQPEFTIQLGNTGEYSLVDFDNGNYGLCFSQGGMITFYFSDPTKNIEIKMCQKASSGREFITFDRNFVYGELSELTDNEFPIEYMNILFESIGKSQIEWKGKTFEEIEFQGLVCGNQLQMSPAFPISFLFLQVYSTSKGVIQVYENDTLLETKEILSLEGEYQNFNFNASNITRIVLNAEETDKLWLYKIWYTHHYQTFATGYDTNGTSYGPYEPASDGIIKLPHNNLTHVEVTGTGQVCICRICAYFGPDPNAVAQFEAGVQHLIDELAHWYHEGYVLEPYTTYRLKIVTELETDSNNYYKDYFDENLLDSSGKMLFSEYAYFRTEGPPGLAEYSTPLNHPNEGEFKSGLNSLKRYVKQTIPNTVPKKGEMPLLPKPVFRAYDVGVIFNEDYVELMYRMARRDLGLYLYDSNNQPVRDVSGKLIVLNNHWGDEEQLTLNELDEYWVSVINGSTCATIDTTKIPHNKTLASAAEGQTLAPDTVYEARLIPLLLHETFTSEDLEDYWKIVDENQSEDGECNNSIWKKIGHEEFSGSEATINGNTIILEDFDGTLASELSIGIDSIFIEKDSARLSKQYLILNIDGNTLTLDAEPDIDDAASSRWKIPAIGGILQTSNYYRGTKEKEDLKKPGTIYCLKKSPGSNPLTWTDYRFSVLVRASDNDAFGVVFRYHHMRNDGRLHYYRFSMDRERQYRRLVRIGNEVALLAEDDFVFVTNQDYLITVEAIGSSLRVYMNGALVFDVEDDKFSEGTIGLYCWGNTNTYFHDVRVDDFSLNAPVVYKFKFVTSLFANFFHFMHSFQDETWKIAIPEDFNPNEHFVKGKSFEAPVTIEENRAYAELAKQLLGEQEAHSCPVELQIAQIMKNEEIQALLIQSPEPIVWERTKFKLLHTKRNVPPSSLPGQVKLTDVTWSESNPNDESVTLLLREAQDLSEYRVDYRAFPEVVNPSTDDPLLFLDNFETIPNQLLLKESFDADCLEQYSIIDQAKETGSSDWVVETSHNSIQQHSLIGEGDNSEENIERAGTVALRKTVFSSNIRIQTEFMSKLNEKNAIGIVFCCDENADNFYRFSFDSSNNVCQLDKNINGQFTVLWQQNDVDCISLNTITIETYNSDILIYRGQGLLCHVQDSDICIGRVGFYCWKNNNAAFYKLSVESLTRSPLLWHPEFENLDELEIINDEETTEGPSNWQAESGALVQTSNIGGTLDDKPGTFALGGNSTWRDFCIFAHLRSDSEGIIGIMFRVNPVLDEDGIIQDYNYYRFSMDFKNGYRCLHKKAGDSIDNIWSQNGLTETCTEFELKIEAIGTSIRIYVDGILLDGFPVYDNTLLQGQIGFYCSTNKDARFEQVVVTDLTRELGGWTIHDEGIQEAPSCWYYSNGALIQTSNIYQDVEVSYPGTYVINGDLNWTDYRLMVQMRSDDNDGIGVIFRFIDHDNYYRLALNAQKGNCQLIKKINGEMKLLYQNNDQGYEVGKSFLITADIIGSRITAYMGDTRLFQVEDPAPHEHGCIGLYAWGNTGARFEQVQVVHPPLDAFVLFQDQFAAKSLEGWDILPDNADYYFSEGLLDLNVYDMPISLFTVNDSWHDFIFQVKMFYNSIGKIGIVWDYSDQNNYLRFIINTHDMRLQLEKCIDGNTTILWESVFYGGSFYEFTLIRSDNRICGFINKIQIFDKILENAFNNSGKIALWGDGGYAKFSQVRIYPIELEFSNWLFHDSFEYFSNSRWTVIDAGKSNTPSNWQIINGCLCQENEAFTRRIDDENSKAPLTYLLAGESSWTDYKTCVHAHLDDEEAAIVILFRYLDENNYYGFILNRTEVPKLIKKSGNSIQLCNVRNIKYEVTSDFIVTITYVNDEIKVHVNGERIVTFTDAAPIPSGKIGIQCIKGRIDEVNISAPQWFPYYKFGSESLLPAGTRVCIHSGNQMNYLLDSAETDSAGVENRFAAVFNTNGTLHFPPEIVGIQVCNSKNTVEHQRYFIDSSQYDELANIRRISKSDNTGFFFLSETNLIEKGQYRLNSTYFRKKTDDAQCEQQSQAGSIADENVTIDFKCE